MEHRSLEDYLARLNIEGDRNVWLRNHAKIEYIFSRAKNYLAPGMSVCEVGVGDGYLLRLMSQSGLKVTGMDISGYLVEKLAEDFSDEETEIVVIQHDISKPLHECKHTIDNDFDIVFCLDLLEHVEALGVTIENIVKLIRQRGLLIATLPWKENLADNMIICPLCHHEFHRVGHYHSFHHYNEIDKMLGESFRIINFGFIPTEGLINKVINFLKKTILRPRYYNGGFPDYQTTCFFIARCNK